ncbi:hypothetical protein CR513_16993, partial [Mucuna pruriens]
MASNPTGDWASPNRSCFKRIREDSYSATLGLQKREDQSREHRVRSGYSQTSTTTSLVGASYP